MEILVKYQPKASQLARASLIFVEKQPVLAAMVILINLMAIMLFLIMLLKITLIPMQTKLAEVMVLLVCGSWVFLRKRFLEWLYTRRMQKSAAIKSDIEINLSLNGIVWSGKYIQDGKMAWENVKYVMRVQNGFIFPNLFMKFLWLPNEHLPAGTSPDDVATLITDKNIKLKSYPKFRC